MPRPGSLLASLLPFVAQRKGFVRQNSLIITAEIKPNQEQLLRNKLEVIGSQLKSNKQILFHRMRAVHYAACLILPSPKGNHGNEDGPARLVMETNYDGELEDHLNDLIDNCAEALDEIYACCEGYPGGARSPAGRASVRTYLCTLHKHTARNPSVYYVALPGRSVEDIRNAICVYEEAKRFIDSCGGARDRGELKSELVAHFRDVSGPLRPRRFAVTQKGLRRLFGFNFALLLLPMALYLLFLWVPLILIARWFENKELKEQRRHPTQDPTDHSEEYSHLDLGTQNHLCTFATVKPGSFRMFVVKRALGLGRILATRFFILGKLDQMTTVHFARWTLVNRQLLFLGNYDGSWSGYLSDFSDQAWGVNLIWSNTMGFPPSRFLWRGGASDLEGFQTQALRHYSPAPVFYSAYSAYSLPNLLRFLQFRDQLAEAVSNSSQ